VHLPAGGGSASASGRVAEIERKVDQLFRLVSELREDVKKP
jgi:hypothetical protein